MLREIGSIVFFPAIAAHELSHFAAAKAVRASPELKLYQHEPMVEYTAKSRRERILINSMPTVVGLILLPFLLPSFGFGIVGAYIALSWFLMTTPSRLDLAGMLAE